MTNREKLPNIRFEEDTKKSIFALPGTKNKKKISNDLRFANRKFRF